MFSSRRVGRFAPALLTAFVALFANCSDVSNPTARTIAPGDEPSPDVLLTTAAVVVTLDSSTLTVPHKTTAHAMALNANGDPLSGKVPVWSSTNPQAATVAANGVVTGVNSGSAVIRAVIDGVTGSDTLTLLPRVPTQLVIGTQPGGAVNGVNLTTQPVVIFRDAVGAVAAVSNTVTASVATGTATLTGLTTVRALNGIVRFTNLHLTGSGSVRLKFTPAPLPVLPPATSVSFGINQPAGGAEGSLAVAVQPNGATTGSPMTTQPVVHILDQSGQVLASSTLAVTAKRTAGNGVLIGTTTVYAVGGVATFTDLRVDGSGTNVLTFSVAVPALSVASAGFNVAIGPPAHLFIRTQPAGAISAAPFTTQPVVEIRDAANQLTAAVMPVTAAVATGTGVLSSPSTVTSVNGVATFSQLFITGTGNHSLRFTAGSPAITVTSNIFNVVIPPLAISRDGGSAAGGAVVTLTGTAFGPGDVVQFGTTVATNVVLINPTTLQVTVPPGIATNPAAPQAVAVSVLHNGVTTTLQNAFTYWPALTHYLATSDFEDGTLGPYTTVSDFVSVVTDVAHSGTHSVHSAASISFVNAEFGRAFLQSDIVGGPGRYHRWYIRIPASTLANTATSGQIKLFLSRTGLSNGFVTLGEGREFNSNDNSLASRIDVQALIIHTGPRITADVWHELQVYEYRDPVKHLGSARIWYDGKLVGTATNALLGDDDPTLWRGSSFGMVYTQHGLGLPIEVYTDDVAIADGYIDPP